MKFQRGEGQSSAWPPPLTIFIVFEGNSHTTLLLLLLLSSFSRVWFSATPWTAARQAPPSTGFSRQEYWSGLPLPSPHYSPPHQKKKEHKNPTEVDIIISQMKTPGSERLRELPKITQLVRRWGVVSLPLTTACPHGDLSSALVWPLQLVLEQVSLLSILVFLSIK